jgi:hypothetical protein
MLDQEVTLREDAALISAPPHGRLINATLEWVVANLNHFRLPSLEDDERVETVTIEGQRKAFGELSLACMLMSRTPTLRTHHHYATLVAYLKEELERPVVFFSMMRRQTLFPFYVTTVVALAACGFELPRYRRTIQKIIDRGHIDAVERTPWNMMDLRYFLDRGGFRHRLPNFETLYPLSVAHRLPPIPEMRPVDVYAITHILFFLSDFGRQDLRAILGERFDETCAYVALLLGTELSRADWDLTGELLLSCTCLGITPRPYFSLAWQALVESQLPDGQIPGPKYDPASPKLQDPDGAAAYRFRCNYHPTLVALLAALAAQERSPEL